MNRPTPARPWIARLAVVALASFATGCNPVPFAPANPEPAPAEPWFATPGGTCDEAFVLVAWNASTPCDVSPPQRLVLWAPADGDPGVWHADCDQFGGIWFADPSTERYYCAAIDY